MASCTMLMCMKGDQRESHRKKYCSYMKRVTNKKKYRKEVVNPYDSGY